VSRFVIGVVWGVGWGLEKQQLVTVFFITGATKQQEK
jgi:hypothetical protein